MVASALSSSVLSSNAAVVTTWSEKVSCMMLFMTVFDDSKECDYDHVKDDNDTYAYNMYATTPM